MAHAAAHVEPDRLAGLTTGAGGDTVYLSAIDRDGNIVSLIQSIFHGFGSGLVAPGTGFALHNRGALFTLEPGHPNELAPGKRPLHTIIPGFMQKGDVRIGFGIMGGFNQAQAHAQFVSNIADFGLDIQQALEAGRFTKPTFSGLDVCVEETDTRGDPARARRPWPRRHRGAAAHGHVRLRTSRDERRHRRALRRLRAATRWRGDSGGHADAMMSRVSVSAES